ncbi:MAG: single-stranded-DNA-specific exonuclease RecJ [Solirubrobacteraceae bacterium]
MPEPALLREQPASPPASAPLRLADVGPATQASEPSARAPDEPRSEPSARLSDEPRLDVPSYDFSAALDLERELGIGHVLSQVLVRRGLHDPGAARDFLQALEEHPPSAFQGMAEVVDLIERHIAGGGRITIHGDYDVDGVCATAIMVRALRARGAQVDWFVPGRIEDGYGLTAETVRRLAARGTELLITVDCAITAVEEVAAARAAGMEVVITDHHHPRGDGALPECPIIHPAVCGYPCPDLCGTGVAHKLAQALGASTVQDDLELVALATVADLMPLRGENRRLVRAGLTTLASTAKPGLRALMAVASVDPSALDTHALAFRLAPRLNAAGRLARADAALELILTAEESRAEEIATELDRLNAERRAVEQRITWEAEAQVAELGPRAAYVLWGEDWHPGVVGIVASRIVERHHRPTVLVALDGPSGTGSARSIPGFDLLGGLRACAGHLERYGGHRAAAGLTLDRDRLDAFRAAMEAHAESILTPELLTRVDRVDAVVSGSQLSLDLIEELELLEPTGLGNPGPRLLVPGARLADVKAMGEGRHARFTVINGGARTPAVAFGCDGSVRAHAGGPVDASFRFERNCWNGLVQPRLVLRGLWDCAPPPIEVLGESDDYLADALQEVARPIPAPTSRAAEASRVIIDRRGQSPLAAVTDVLATGSVLVLCTDVGRRLEGLRTRVGGFCLACYHALELDPNLADRFEHLVELDPPGCEAHDGLLRSGVGFTHLAWGEAELRFAQEMHEFEYGLRTSLVAVYRSLRLRRQAAGEELERLLRGEASPGRPARLAGRLVRVLSELELVSLDRDLPALALVGGGAPTALERSPAYRAYTHRHEDGRQFLSSANQRPRS